MILAGDIFEEILKTLKTDGRVSENRGSLRVGIRARIRIIPLHNDTPGTPSIVWSRDISASGIGLIYTEPVKVGTRFFIELDREENLPIRLLCEVVRRDMVASGIYVVGARYVAADAQAHPSAGPREAATPPPPVDAEIIRIRNAVIGD